MKNDMIHNGHQNTTDGELISLAEKLCIKSAILECSQTTQVQHALMEQNRNVNSYYSNAIDFEGTHPSLMDRYNKEGLSTNSKEARLQLNSLEHIKLQKIMEEHFDGYSIDSFSEKFIYDIHNKLFESSDNEYIGKITYSLSTHTTEAEKVINALKLHYIIISVHHTSNKYRVVARLVLDGILSTLKGYGLWNITRGLHKHSTEYEEYLNMNDNSEENESSNFWGLSPETFRSYIKFMLDIALEEVNYAKEHLTINKMYTNIQHYVHLSREELFDQDPLPENSELLFKELLLLGEIPRGDVAVVINKKPRTATYLNKKLTNMDFITSDTPKGPIRLKFNMHFASYLFPELIR